MMPLFRLEGLESMVCAEVLRPTSPKSASDW